MKFTDTSERGLEHLICTILTGKSCDFSNQGQIVELFSPGYSGVGWSCGNPRDYDREFCVDLVQLAVFLRNTQPKHTETLSLNQDSPTRRKFLARLQGEISKRGTIEVLRHGIKYGPVELNLFFGTPSVGNEKAQLLFNQNRFTVVRQLRYSHDDKQRSLDIGLFINGLPLFTFELKNRLTKQTVHDAVEQYKRDRNPREKLFEFGRCIAHFAVDENEIYFCTKLNGKASWFLPFNQGWNDGAGNPPNSNGIKTDFLWRKILNRKSLTNILENYAQVVVSQDPKSMKKRIQIWPRYHQLDLVRSLLDDVKGHGAGRRYLIQHSAGSGKSYSITWLAHQLVRLEKDGQPIFDSIIVITDRVNLDRQIRDTIKKYAQVRSTMTHAEHSGDLRKAIESGKKIIISTVQKFPFILDDIGNEHRGRQFAIIIDEAHSSQGGRISTAISQVLSETENVDEEMTVEDQINRLIESRKLLSNASYFAFTATPKNKTLELFGKPHPLPDNTVQHRPFHTYSMKQAIQEGFILDVLAHYTPVKSYYKLAKKIEDDPEFDAKKANKKLWSYVEGHDHAIRLKAEIMVDHFLDQVVSKYKIGGEARAMVVTSGVALAIQYFHCIRDYLKQRKSAFQAIVAFSGEPEYFGTKVSETSLNGFPSRDIAAKLREKLYRILVCADKFQTGYDEPLLHTMYVDKNLSGIKAVQTLSRLNRAHPQKHDVFVLDFQNDTEIIQFAFADYYRTTILADKTDPDKLHDLQADLDGVQVYSPDQIDKFVELYLGDAERDRLDPILDDCVRIFQEQLDEDEQVAFKGKAKAFVRTYSFLSCVLTYPNPAWEKRSIFLSFLIPKLPAPQDDDLSKGILDAIDMDSYRVEKLAMQQILLPDEDAKINPIPTEGDGQRSEPDLNPLSRILDAFNDLFADIGWNDNDRVKTLITETIPGQVAKDSAFRNAQRNSDPENARIEFDRVLRQVMMAIMKDDTQLFKQFQDNEGFQRWVTDSVYELASEKVNRSQIA